MNDGATGLITAPSSDTEEEQQSEVWEQKAAAEILDCAVTVFAKHGYGMGGMRAVAREGGFSLAKAYYYYPKKEALLQAIVERALIRMTKVAFLKTEEGTSPAERLYKLVEATLDYHAHNFDEFKVLYKDSDILIEESAKRVQFLRQEFTKHVDSCIFDYQHQGLQRTRSENGNARAGFYLIALMSWTLMNRYRLQEPLPIAVLAEEICALYFEGVNALFQQAESS